MTAERIVPAQSGGQEKVERASSPRSEHSGARRAGSPRRSELACPLGSSTIRRSAAAASHRHPLHVTLNSQRLRPPGLQQDRWAVWPLREQALGAWAAVAFVFVWVELLWLLGGVGGSDAALFTVWELVFVGMPGWVCYGVLRPGAPSLERLAFGWALGYALEIGAFAVTASAGVRGLLFVYPVPFAAVGLWRLARAERQPRPRVGADRRWSWAAAAIAAAATGMVAAALFPTNPLPGSVHRVTYFLDNVFQISLAADALHHWPITDPTVSGEPFPYHTFAHMLMASATQITGIGLPTVVLRLLPMAMVALLAVQLAYAGARLAGNRMVGLVAAVLVLFTGELDLDPNRGPISSPFLGTFFVHLWYSPTFLLGLLFFVPLVVVLSELLTDDESSGELRTWLLFGILFAAGCGAKAAIPPVVIGGLALFLVVQRRFDRRTVTALLLSSVIFAGFLATMYRGGNAGMRFAADAAAYGSGSQRVIDWLKPLVPVDVAKAAGVGVGVVGLFGASLFGLIWFAGRGTIPRSYRLLLCLFAVALVPYFFIAEPGVSQLFFMEYGFVAAAIVSATGVYWLWRGDTQTDRTHRSLELGFGAAWMLVLLLGVGLATALKFSGRHTTLVWAGVLVSTVLFFAAAALRTRAGQRRTWVRLLLITLLGAAALDAPLDVFPHLIHESRRGTLYVHGGTGLTTDLYRGLRWIRANTSSRDVLAVSNYSVDSQNPEFDDVYYSAFAERRTFLEGWAYTMKTLKRGGFSPRLKRSNSPFPRRLRLNDAVFQRGDRKALETIVRDYGVRYLVVDRVHGGDPARVASLGRRVFSNPAVAVFAVGT
jgi:hypothetical protein